MSLGHVVLTVEEYIATITIDRPAKLNALSPAMLGELEAAAEAIERDAGLRVVVLTGAGEQAFCVGADIAAWSALEPLEMWRSWVRTGHRVFGRLAGLRQPVIAAINGHCFGGGLELALATDLRLVAAEAELAMPEVTIATVPGWGGTARLPELVGPARAKQLILGGGRIDAATAERWGLANEVLPRAALLPRAYALAAQIAANAPLSVQLAKQLIDGRAAALPLEAMAGALAAASADGREGQAAFREKRPPRYEGR